MKISKAIEILNLDVKGRPPVDYDKWVTATKLGIEALKRVLNSRVEPRYSSVDPLPGETRR